MRKSKICQSTAPPVSAKSSVEISNFVGAAALGMTGAGCD